MYSMYLSFVCYKAILWSSQWFKFLMLLIYLCFATEQWIMMIWSSYFHVVCHISFSICVCETVCKTWWQSIRKGRTKREHLKHCHLVDVHPNARDHEHGKKKCIVCMLRKTQQDFIIPALTSLSLNSSIQHPSAILTRAWICKHSTSASCPFGQRVYASFHLTTSWFLNTDSALIKITGLQWRVSSSRVQQILLHIGLLLCQGCNINNNREIDF